MFYKLFQNIIRNIKKIFFNSGYEDLNERNTGKDRLCFKRNDVLIATLERFDRLWLANGKEPARVGRGFPAGKVPGTNFDKGMLTLF